MLPSIWSFLLVLVVRVGCIIEAHPSPNNSNEHKVPHHHVFTTTTTIATPSGELETAASHSIITSPTNSFASSGVISKKPSSTPSLGSRHQIPILDGEAVSVSTKSFMSTTTLTSTSVPTTFTITTASSSSTPNSQGQQHIDGGSEQMLGSGNGKFENEKVSNVQGDSDDCSGKADGYYQNFGSGCTSYYFCAAGYQITYVCPIGSKFNGKRCEDDYNCPTAGHVNDCKEKSNGYYPNNKTPGKYFYCFQQAKVIELQCETGKVFVVDKCIRSSEILETGNEERTTTSCTSKSNGFYQDLSSNCEKYYYCIGGEKRDLRCQTDYIFNGDICIHSSRYQCPRSRNSNSDKRPVERQMMMSLKKVKSTTDGKQSSLKEGMKLPITTGKTSTTSTSLPLENVEKTTITVDSHLFDPNDV